MAGPESERRPLTVMSLGIVDSARIASSLDDEILRALMQGIHEAWGRVVGTFGGTIIRLTGDGALAYFGYPDAFEGSAVRAAHAALGIAKLSNGEKTDKPADASQVAVRIGIATGVVLVGGPVGEGASSELPAYGIAPYLAARLQGIADPNAVAVSAATRDLIAADFECESIGSFPFKGLAQPVPAWRVVRPRSGAAD